MREVLLEPVLSEVCFAHHCVAVCYPLFTFGFQILRWHVLSCLELSFPGFCRFPYRMEAVGLHFFSPSVSDFGFKITNCAKC